MTDAAALPGSSLVSPPNPTTISAGATRWVYRIETDFTTNNNVPFTPATLAIPLVVGRRHWIHVKGMAAQVGGGELVFEFDARNVWKRTAAGVSSRVGVDIGFQTNVANQFPAPPATRPSTRFSDPAASNVGSVLFTGRAATVIKWSVVSELIVMS